MLSGNFYWPTPNLVSPYSAIISLPLSMLIRCCPKKHKLRDKVMQWSIGWFEILRETIWSDFKKAFYEAVFNVISYDKLDVEGGNGCWKCGSSYDMDSYGTSLRCVICLVMSIVRQQHDGLFLL
ncbi:hypothetical protein O9929_18550 [Vibrio lentus]|nr:hypothetical protein [Vibrio lentus]